MRRGSRVWVAGHRGLVGSALVRRLTTDGHRVITRTRQELDLADASAVSRFFAASRPEYVFLAAAKVGGIHANSAYPADFIACNLAIQQSVILAAHRCGVEKLLFLGSSCIYPREAPQPIREESLLSGPLEPTNEWYAVAKIAGIKLVQALRAQHGFRGISVMPTNLYGPGDDFHPENSHVLPALMRRFHDAARTRAGQVTVWGSGRPRREFLHVDDLADACVFLLDAYDSSEIINIGYGSDISIRDVSEMLARVTGFRGDIEFDASKPDGTPRKLLDSSRLAALGWRPRIELEEGLRATYRWYRDSLLLAA